MIRTLLPALAALLLLPAAASAATVTADIEVRGGLAQGPVKFKAAPDEANELTISRTDNGRLRFHDDANPVDARGDCEQVDGRTAVCPTGEDIVKVRLGDRGDEATTSDPQGNLAIFAGAGFDVLRGSNGPDLLNGQAGGDVLRGGRSEDDLNGGPGEDAVFGGSDDDALIDGETDAQAATDVYRGGAHRQSASPGDGDSVVYAKRDRGLEIDFSANQVSAGPEGDDLVGVEGALGGSGDDRLVGDAGKNPLDGGPGDDIVRGGGGKDIPSGGPGDDDVRGEGGRDVVWGLGGTDSLSGGSGDDSVLSDDTNAERVRCGPGDDDVRQSRTDRLAGCEVAQTFLETGTIYVKVQPSISGDTATFQVACQELDPCNGSLTLTGLGGEDYGSGEFTGLANDPQTFADVEVALTQAGVDALAEGVVVQVSIEPRGGYRAFMQSG